MKRSPLQRSSSLSSVGKRGKKGPSMAGFWAVVTENGTKRCEACSAWRVGYMDAHHFVPQARLRRHGAPLEALTDPRNGVCLDRVCHEHVENRRMECPRPPDLDAFLEDHQLLESGRPIPKGRAA